MADPGPQAARSGQAGQPRPRRRDDVTGTELVGGTGKRALTLASYDPAWPQVYRAQERRIRAALRTAARSVEHIGPTSVAGLAAQLVIDILVTVGDITAEEEHVSPLLHERTKRRLLAQDRPDMNADADAKTAVIEQIRQRARGRARWPGDAA